MTISTVEEILDDFRQGKMVLMMDDEDRENEGDLIIAADVVTPEHITFFARNACGLICLTITEERAKPKTFDAHTMSGIGTPGSGISTSSVVTRFNSLKYTSYT